jgi:DNA-binding NarL/FixJ family response regulator
VAVVTKWLKDKKIINIDQQPKPGIELPEPIWKPLRSDWREFELEVLDLAHKGRSNAEIARELQVSMFAVYIVCLKYGLPTVRRDRE